MTFLDYLKENNFLKDHQLVTEAFTPLKSAKWFLDCVNVQCDDFSTDGGDVILDLDVKKFFERYGVKDPKIIQNVEDAIFDEDYFKFRIVEFKCFYEPKDPSAGIMNDSLEFEDYTVDKKDIQRMIKAFDMMALSAKTKVIEDIVYSKKVSDAVYKEWNSYVYDDAIEEYRDNRKKRY